MRAKLPDIDLATARQFLPPGLIDRPPIADSLAHWLDFLGGLEEFWQGNRVIQREVSFAKAVIAWKDGGENGAAPELGIQRLTKLSNTGAQNSSSPAN